jgi:hypothetical protein
MDIKRIRHLAGLTPLNEDLTPDPAVNDRIMAYVDQFSGDTWHVVHDAIDVIYSAGPQGVTVAEWAARVRQINPAAEDVMTVLKDVAKHFVTGGHIRRTEDRRYLWVMESGIQAAPPAAGDDLDDVSPEMRNAVGQQVGMTYEALAIIRERGEIAASEWASLLANRFGLPVAMAHAYVTHMVQQFRGIIVPAGADRWRYQEEAPSQDAMSLFRDIVRKPGPLPGDEV